MANSKSSPKEFVPLQVNFDVTVSVSAPLGYSIDMINQEVAELIKADGFLADLSRVAGVHTFEVIKIRVDRTGTTLAFPQEIHGHPVDA